MENQQPQAAAAKQKKAFKIPKWAISLGILALVIVIIVVIVAIASAASKNPGVRVLENYISALQRGNVRNFVSTFEARGTDEFDRTLAVFNEQVNEFNGLDRDSARFIELWNRGQSADGEGSAVYLAPDFSEPLERAMEFYVERIIAQSIVIGHYEIIINDPNFIQLSVLFQFEPPIVRADDTIPGRYWQLIGRNLQQMYEVLDSRILNFRRINNRWVFADEFRFFRRYQNEIETWFSPITIDGVSGYELMNVHRNDVPANGIFDASYRFRINSEGQRENILTAPVVAIANRAFVNVAAATASADNNLIRGNRLEHVILNQEVRRLGVSAFEGLMDLAGVSFTDELTAADDANFAQINFERNSTRPLVINEAAFRNTRALRSFTVSHVANPVIPNRAFQINITSTPTTNRQRGLTSFSFENFRAIGHQSFAGTGLTNISLWEYGGENAHDTLVTIGDGAFEFSGITALTAAYYAHYADGERTIINNRLSERVTRIGANAFRGTRLTGLAIPHHFTSVPLGIADGVSTLLGFRFSERLLEVGESALRGTAIRRVDLPRAVRHIGSDAFANTRQLQVFNFANNPLIATVGARAFQHSTGLPRFTLPQSIRSIGAEAFYGTTGLRYVMIDADHDIQLGSRIFSVAHGIPKFYIPEGADILDYSVRRWAEINPQFRHQVFPREIIETTADGARMAIETTGRMIPDPQNASILRPERVLIQYLSGHAAGGLVDLRPSDADIAYNNGVGRGLITAIAPGAFARDLEIREIRVNSDLLTWIGEDAFFGADNLGFIEARLNPRAWLRMIGDTGDSRTATSMWLIDGITRTQETAGGAWVVSPGFGHSELDLTSYRLTGDEYDLRNVVGIANGGFSERATLSLLNLGRTRFVGDGVFAGATGLIEIEFGVQNEILEIGDDAFARASSLSSVEFPSSLRRLGDRVFYGTPQLRFVIIHSAVLDVGIYTFSALDNILHIYARNFNTNPIFTNQVNWVDTYGYADRLDDNRRPIINPETNRPFRDWVRIRNGYNRIMHDLSILYHNGIRQDFAVHTPVTGGPRYLIQYIGDEVFEEFDTYYDTRDIPHLAGISVIGRGAFARTEIERLIINTNIVRIEDNAFFGITNLTQIHFANQYGTNMDRFGQGGASQIYRIGSGAFFETPATARDGGDIRIFHSAPHADFTMGVEAFQLTARIIAVNSRANFTGAINADGTRTGGNASWIHYEIFYNSLRSYDDPSLRVSKLIVDDRVGQGDAGRVIAGTVEIDEQGEYGIVEGRPGHAMTIRAAHNTVGGFTFRGWLAVFDPANPDHADLARRIVDGVEYVIITSVSAFQYRFSLLRDAQGVGVQETLYALFERTRITAFVGSQTNAGHVTIFAPSRQNISGQLGSIVLNSPSTPFSIPLAPVTGPRPSFYDNTRGQYFLAAANIQFFEGNPSATFNGWDTYERVLVGNEWIRVRDVENQEIVGNLQQIDEYMAMLGTTRVLWVDGQVARITIGEAGAITTNHRPHMRTGASYIVLDQHNRVFIITNYAVSGVVIYRQIASMIRVFIADQDIMVRANWGGV